MSKKLNFVFWGTPEVASETLEILKQAGLWPALIVTSPDAKKGRGWRLQASPVALFAEKNNIPCFKLEKLDQKEIWNILRTSPERDIDFFLVVAYGKIIPENLLNKPKFGSINVHYSLLPKYRGASPVESAILNGETETGVTIQQIEFKMDSGPINAKEKTNILDNEKTTDLRKRLIKIGGKLLIKTLPKLINKEIKMATQNENEATYCKKIKKEDGLVNLETESPNVLYNKFRAYAFWPRIFFFKNNKRIIITKARLEDDKFIIEKIIPENGKETDYKKYKARPCTNH